MTTAYLVTAIARTFLGATKKSAKHREIIATFNKVKPHGYKASTSDPWCAESWSAWQIMAGNTAKQVPLSASCTQIIADAKKLGIWQEDESVKPQIGWGVLYDWQDGGKGNNVGSPDHIGIVYAVDSKYLYVIEGNKGTASVCGTRAVAINGRYLRGFVKPKYKEQKKVTYKPNKAFTGTLPKAGIAYGTSGAEVKKLQQFLNWCLGYSLKIDGGCGVATTQAIIDYQYTYGLDPDGSFGTKSLGKAQSIVKSFKTATATKTTAQKIADEALRLAWPKGTAASVYKKSATAAYKKAAKKWYPKSTNLTACHLFVATALSEAGKTGMPVRPWASIFKWLRANCTEIKVDYTQTQLKAGDIRVHKNSNGGYHIWLITDNKGTRAEASQGNTYPHINSSNKGNVTRHKGDWLFRAK